MNKILMLNNSKILNASFIQLGARTGMEIKLPLTRNFSYFLNKGILNFIDEVKKILDEANETKENEESEI